MTPTLSIVIPTRDRPHWLRDCLGALAVQTTSDFEVVVVDDGGTADLHAVVSGLDPTPARLRLVRRSVPGGASAARNTGVEAAAGTVVGLLDDDTLPAPGWAEAVIDTFARTGCDGMAGRTRLLLDPMPRWLVPGMRRLLGELDLGPEERRLEAELPHSANCALTRTAFEQVGGFLAGFGKVGSSLLSNDEIEMFRRMRARGMSFVYQPRAEVGLQLPPDRVGAGYLRARAYAQGVSAVLLEALEGRQVRYRALRELLRAGRAVPILAKGILQRRGALAALIWLDYCRGRLAKPTPEGKAP